MTCPNCHTEFEGLRCSQCGQKAGINRLTIREFLSEIPMALLNLERRYWHTIKDFCVNPLQMVRAYSEGRRKYYAPPIQFMFFFASLNFLLGVLLAPFESEKEKRYEMALE